AVERGTDVERVRWGQRVRGDGLHLVEGFHGRGDARGVAQPGDGIVAAMLLFGLRSGVTRRVPRLDLADRVRLQRPGVDLVVGLERHRAGPGLSAAQDLHAVWALGLQREQGPGDLRGPGLDVEELEERNLRGVRDLVEAV